LTEWKRAFEFEADPPQAGIDLFREVLRRADDGEFVGCPCKGGEFAFRGPVGDWNVGRQAHDGILRGKMAEFELLA